MMRNRRVSAAVRDDRRLRARPIRVVLFALVVAALALPSTGAAFAGGSAADGSYKGFVGPGYPMTFKVSGSSVDDLVVAFDETCNGAPPNTAPKFYFKTLTLSDGKFSGATAGDFGPTFTDNLEIKGSLSGEKASGTVTSKSWVKSLGSCTQTEPFDATLKK
jgi:hypothetical protein